MSHYYYPIFVVSIFFLIIISKKLQYFIDQKKDKHKKIFNPKKNFFLGGIILFFFIMSILILKGKYIELLFLFSIFFLGILSDFKILNDPKKRFILQGIVIFVFVTFLEIKISSTRLDVFDLYLQNNILNCVFVVFCLMILINGSNFVDGLNTLLITYKIFILLTLIIFFDGNFIFNHNNYDLLFILLLILILNSFGIIILGDSGAYLISTIFGLSLIDFSNQNNFISPFFIILLLWYPCFELLYSIIRRLSSNKKTYNADIKHFHQLLYLRILKRSKFNFKINHFITSLIINLYNFFIFCLGVNFIYQTKILIIIIGLNMVLYLIFYNFLNNKIKR